MTMNGSAACRRLGGVGSERVGAEGSAAGSSGGRTVAHPRRAATVLSRTATIRIAPWTRLIRYVWRLRSVRPGPDRAEEEDADDGARDVELAGPEARGAEERAGVGGQEQVLAGVGRVAGAGAS